MNIVGSLNMLAKFKGDHGMASIEDFVLRHGKEYKRVSKPDDLPYGEAKMCYMNAFGAAWDADKYTYCEGFVLCPGCIPFPIPHAWLIDKDGNAVDNTLRDGGRECGFCLGTGEREEPIYDDDGDEDGYDTVDCAWCKGTGEQDYDHPSREGCEYYGVALDHELAIRLTMEQGTYGIIEAYATEVLTKEKAA
jgi:hypothetical protein